MGAGQRQWARGSGAGCTSNRARRGTRASQTGVETARLLTVGKVKSESKGNRVFPKRSAQTQAAAPAEVTAEAVPGWAATGPMSRVASTSPAQPPGRARRRTPRLDAALPAQGRGRAPRPAPLAWNSLPPKSSCEGGRGPLVHHLTLTAAAPKAAGRCAAPKAPPPRGFPVGAVGSAGGERGTETGPQNQLLAQRNRAHSSQSSSCRPAAAAAGIPAPPQPEPPPGPALPAVPRKLPNPLSVTSSSSGTTRQPPQTRSTTKIKMNKNTKI